MRTEFTSQIGNLEVIERDIKNTLTLAILGVTMVGLIVVYSVVA
jgi:hypothetical protein